MTVRRKPAIHFSGGTSWRSLLIIRLGATLRRDFSQTARSAPMRQPHSIRFHLSVVFIFFFLLIFFLGMLSIARLRDFNNVSADIADVWLPNTRVVGDLNNFTSDFRAAEGTSLLSPGAERDTIEREMVDLDRTISQAQHSYERIRHD